MAVLKYPNLVFHDLILYVFALNFFPHEHKYTPYLFFCFDVLFGYCKPKSSINIGACF